MIHVSLIRSVHTTGHFEHKARPFTGFNFIDIGKTQNITNGNRDSQRGDRQRFRRQYRPRCRGNRHGRQPGIRHQCIQHVATKGGWARSRLQPRIELLRGGANLLLASQFGAVIVDIPAGLAQHFVYTMGRTHQHAHHIEPVAVLMTGTRQSHTGAFGDAVQLSSNLGRGVPRVQCFFRQRHRIHTMLGTQTELLLCIGHIAVDGDNRDIGSTTQHLCGVIAHGDSQLAPEPGELPQILADFCRTAGNGPDNLDALVEQHTGNDRIHCPDTINHSFDFFHGYHPLVIIVFSYIGL